MLNDIAWGEEVRPVREEIFALLKSAPVSKTASTAIQTTIVTLQGGDLAVAELVNNILREVVEAGKSKVRDRELRDNRSHSSHARGGGLEWPSHQESNEESRTGALASSRDIIHKRCKGGRKGDCKEGEAEGGNH